MTWVQKAGSAEEAYKQAQVLDPQAKLTVSKVSEGKYLVRTSYRHITGTGSSARISKKIDTYTESVRPVPKSVQAGAQVSIGPPHGTREEAEKASARVSRTRDVHTTHVIKRGEAYQVVGKYTGDLKKVRITTPWQQRALKNLEEKGETVIAGRRFTKEEVMPTAVEQELKPGEIKLQPEKAYIAGLISQRDLESARKSEGSYIITTGESLRSAEALRKKWKNVFTTEPAPGQREIDRYLWAEKEVPYMAEDKATRKIIATVSKGMTAKEIEELKAPTFGMNLIDQARSMRTQRGKLSHGEGNVLQWMGEAVIEYGGSVLHGGEILTRPAGRKVIGNILSEHFSQTEPMSPLPSKKSADAMRKFEPVQGTALNKMLTDTGKELVANVQKSPVEFGVKLATVAALSYGISKGVGHLRAARTPITHSAGKGQIFVSSKGKTAVGRADVATIMGKGGKQGKFMTRITSSFRKTGERAVHGQKEVTTRGKHILKTQREPTGKIFRAKGYTTDVSIKTGQFTDISRHAGSIVRKGRLGKTKVSYAFGKQKHVTVADVYYDKPSLIHIGKSKTALVQSKADVVSYGKAVQFKFGKSIVRPKIIHKVKVGKREISVFDYAKKMQRTGEIKIKYTAKLPRQITKGADKGKVVFGTYEFDKKLITMPPKGVLPKTRNIFMPSEKGVLAHEIQHMRQTLDVKRFRTGIEKQYRAGKITKRQGDVMAKEFVKRMELEAHKAGTYGKFFETRIVHRPTVRLTQPKIKITGKGDMLSKTDIYQLADPGVSAAGKGGTLFYKTVLPKAGRVAPTFSGVTELAKKAGETAAIESLRKQLSTAPYMIPSPRVITRPSILDVVIESPAKLIMGPSKKREPTLPGPGDLLKGPIEETRARVSTTSGILDSIIQKRRPDMGRATISQQQINMGFGTGTAERVIPAMVTPQVVSPRMRQFQTEALLMATITGRKSRVGHPTPVFQTLLPSTFRPATLFPMMGMGLEEPIRKKKKRPMPWWAGMHIHPVKSPLELFGFPAQAKTRRRRK